MGRCGKKCEDGKGHVSSGKILFPKRASVSKFASLDQPPKHVLGNTRSKQPRENDDRVLLAREESKRYVAREFVACRTFHSGDNSLMVETRGATTHQRRGRALARYSTRAAVCCAAEWDVMRNQSPNSIGSDGSATLDSALCYVWLVLDLLPKQNLEQRFSDRSNAAFKLGARGLSVHSNVPR